MGVSTLIPGHKKLSVPSFTILIGGVDVTAKYGIVSVMVNKSINRVPVAEVVLYDGSAAKQDFELSNKPDFVPGSDVIIKAGYAQIEKKIFEGIVTRFSIKAPLNAPSTLMLEIRDKSAKMTINRKNKYFADKTDSDIMKSVIQESGLQADVASTTATHKEMVQYYATDWDFVLSRAEANGLLVFVEDGKVSIQKPVFALKGDSLNLQYGDNIVDIEAEMDARDQYGDVTAKDWDYSKQEVVEKKATPPSMGKEEGNISGKDLSDVLGVSDYLLQSPVKMLDAELTAWASAKLLRSRMSKIKGRVRIYGTNAIKPGDVINLMGVGKRFNGAAYCSSVVHSYGAHSTWYTDIIFGFSQEWFYEKYDNIVDKGSAGLLPAVNGLVTGIVTDIVDEEGGEFRVRVRIPLIDNGDKGVWARIVAADAGNDRGILIRPEKDDEVILGFVNDDPRDPVILGMLYSKKNKVPAELTPDKDNKIKGWITKSKIKFLIDDDKKTVTVITPAKNKIVLDDDKKSITLEDQNKNKIVMDDKGILMDTPKDFVVNAKGKITLTGTKDVTAESKSGKLVVKGTSSAEISASGSTTVKGATVKIN
ncbi:MAG TPA: type VI secretion system tip protein VgrG [Bacteroidia bacterium]|nr:type VI secretion system tip protein VgrG [Bacteroidia bacterium]